MCIYECICVTSRSVCICVRLLMRVHVFVTSYLLKRNSLHKRLRMMIIIYSSSKSHSYLNYLIFDHSVNNNYNYAKLQVLNACAHKAIPK